MGLSVLLICLSLLKRMQEKTSKYHQGILSGALDSLTRKSDSENVLMWVPGHVSALGNEWVVKVAKKQR